MAFAWVAGVAGMAAMASKPDPYMLHVMDIPAPHPFPWLEVVIFGFIMAAEAVLLWAAIEPSLSPGIPVRAGLVAALFSIGSFVCILGSMHSSNAYWIHMMWLFALTLTALMVTLRSAILQIVRFLERRG